MGIVESDFKVGLQIWIADLAGLDKWLKMRLGTLGPNTETRDPLKEPYYIK